MKHKYRKITIIVAVVLFVISTVYVILGSSKATYRLSYYPLTESTVTIKKVEIENPDVINYDGYSADKNNHYVHISAKNKGFTKVHIEYNTNTSNELMMDDFTVHVHLLNVITIDGFFGEVQGSWIYGYALFFFILYFIVVLIIVIIKRDKENIYSYTTAWIRGLLIFNIFASIYMIYSIIVHLKNSAHIANNFLAELVSYLPYYFVFFLCIFLIPFLIMLCISNISLIIHEGKELTNFLGIILSIVIIGLTFFVPVINSNIYNLFVYNLDNVDMETFTHIFVYYESFIGVLVSYFDCVLVGIILSVYYSLRRKVKLDKDFVIILGCQIDKDGYPLPLLKGRIDKAIEFRNKQLKEKSKDLTFVVSGGKGDDEVVSEAEAMKRYLIDQGISEDRIILEDKSVNTFENLRNSKNIIYKINDKAKIAFSTTNYHVYRAGILLSTVKMKAQGLGAKTKWYFWPNALIREFIAIVVSHKKAHIAFFTVSLAVFILDVVLSVLSKVL